jgi:hypothetical protein
MFTHNYTDVYSQYGHSRSVESEFFSIKIIYTEATEGSLRLLDVMEPTAVFLCSPMSSSPLPSSLAKVITWSSLPMLF